MAGADRIVQPYSTAGREMAKLVLKPQVAAFLDIVSTSRRRRDPLRGDRRDARLPARGATIGELRVRDVTGAMIIAVRKADGSFDTTPSPTLRARGGRHHHRRRQPRRAARARRAVQRRTAGRRSESRTRAPGRRAGRRGWRCGRAGAAERSETRRLRHQRRAPARPRAPEESARAGPGAERGRRAHSRRRARRGRRPRLSEPLSRRRLVRRGAGRDARRRPAATAPAARRAPSASRWSSSRPTRPGRSRSGRRGTRAYGDSLARLLAFAGNEVEREYYVNDRGTQIDLFRASVEARRRGEEPPEGRLPRRLRLRDRAWQRRSGACR